MRRQLEQNQGRTIGLRQNGSVAILAAISISAVVISLASIDIGNQFWQQRNIQKIADTAALAGSQRLGEGCAKATEAAISIKDQNSSSAAVLEVTCGNWSPSRAGESGQLGGSGLIGNPTNHFSSDSTLTPNSVKIKASLTFPNWFLISASGRASVAAEAIGYNEPIAGFSLGTGVAAVEGGVVNTLLGGLLGINLDIASYSGIADANLNLQDLAIATRAGTVEKLLATSITTQNLIVAMIDALGPNVLATSVLQMIKNAPAAAATPVLNSIEVKISDILKIDSPLIEGAASAQVNVFEMLLVAAQIANGKNAVKLKSGLELGALARVDINLAIVEPPSIAIGPAGKNGAKWRTEARSASIRLSIESSVLDTSKLPGLSSLLTIKTLAVPINIQAAPAKAWLSEINCRTPILNSTVVIGSIPGLATACVAEGAGALGTPQACDTPAVISTAEVLFLSAYKIRAKTNVLAQTPANESANLQFDGFIGNSDDKQRTATKINSILTETLKSGLSNLQLEACTLLGCIPISGALSGVTKSLNDAIILPLVGSGSNPGLITQLIQPLLELLGVQLGYSDVRHQSLSCKNSELVF